MPKTSDTRKFTVHLDLSHVHAGDVSVLHVLGREYEMIRHTPESLEAALPTLPKTLCSVTAELVPTHFAEHVALPVHQLVSYWVYSGPRDAPLNDLKVTDFGLSFPDHDEDAHGKVKWWPVDQVALSILFHHPEIMNLRTGTDDPQKYPTTDVSRIIKYHIIGSFTFQSFVEYIRVNRKTFSSLQETIDPSTGKPVVFHKGKHRGQKRTYVAYSAECRQNMAKPISSIIKSVKNDPQLRGWNWRVLEGVASSATPAPSGSAVPETTLNFASASLGPQSGMSFNLQTPSSTNREFSFEIVNNYLRYISVYIQFFDANQNLINPDLEFFYNDATTQGFASVVNSAPANSTAVPTGSAIQTSFSNKQIQLTTQAVYQVRYDVPDNGLLTPAIQPPVNQTNPVSTDAVVYDPGQAAGSNNTWVLSTSGLTNNSVNVYNVTPWNPGYSTFEGALATTLASVDLHTDTTRYLNYISAVPTILSVPTTTSSQGFPAIPLPLGATAARILAGGGLGFYYDVSGIMSGAAGGDVWRSGVLGLAITGFIDLALPALSLTSGTGDNGGALENAAASLLSGSDGQVIFAGLLGVVAGIDGAVIGTGSPATSIVSTITNKLLGFMLNSPTVAKTVAGIIAGDLAEDAVPLVGQVLEAISVASTIASLAETTYELLTTPYVIDNTVTGTFTLAVTINHDPRDKGGFPESAQYYDLTLVYAGGTVLKLPLTAFQQNGLQSQPFIAYVPNLPVTGLYSVRAGFYPQDNSGNPNLANPVGVYPATDGVSIQYDASTTAGQSISITITELMPELNNTTQYHQSEKLWYTEPDHTWNPPGPPPAGSVPAATVQQLDPTGNGTTQLCSLNKITVSEVTAEVAYAWWGEGQDAVIFGSADPTKTYNTGVYTIQSISTTSSPDAGLIYNTNPAVGFNQSILVVYELTPPKLAGMPPSTGPEWQTQGYARPPYNFFIQPATQPPIGSVPCYVRTINVGDTQFGYTQTQSWGVFPNPPVDVAIHPAGYIVGLANGAIAGTTRLYIIKLPQAAVDDAQAPMAKLASGQGNRQNLLVSPVAVGCTESGAILVLDAGQKKILAFDISGNPLTSQFAGQQPGTTSNEMALNVQSQPETYLDMAIESKGFIYVLVYDPPPPSQPAQPANYRIDIYQPDGAYLVTTTTAQPIPTARITVDLFRNLYTLNYESFSGPGGRLEPSVSTLTPTSD